MNHIICHGVSPVFGLVRSADIGLHAILLKLCPETLTAIFNPDRLVLGRSHLHLFRFANY
ncbi:hypothetical protein [Chlorogloeopsis sp. ULAP02]|uniref:hypothetical protein n=1 Tax=Chlorogloeopsis sp. ULAP02 TaxID=3107926 RepID=UPI0031348FB2